MPTGGDANQAVTDSRTGKVLYVDTTGINSTGVELVRVPGTYDVFSTLINIRDLLKNDRNLSDSQIQQLRNASIRFAGRSAKPPHPKGGLRWGRKSGFLSNLKSSLESVKSNNEDETSQLQQADIAQIAIDLSRQQALYQMSLSVAGKMMSLSLLDFIASSRYESPALPSARAEAGQVGVVKSSNVRYLYTFLKFSSWCCGWRYPGQG